MWSKPDTRVVRIGAQALGAGVLSALLIGVPTDVIDTPLFTRMTPVRAWEYPVLALTAALTAAWIALHAARAKGFRGGVFGSSLLSAFAVGCPICNKIVVALLGVSGALGIWAPIQPVLGGISVAMLAVAVTLQWRRTRRPLTCTATPGDQERIDQHA